MLAFVFMTLGPAKAFAPNIIIFPLSDEKIFVTIKMRHRGGVLTERMIQCRTIRYSKKQE